MISGWSYREGKRSGNALTINFNTGKKVTTIAQQHQSPLFMACNHTKLALLSDSRSTVIPIQEISLQSR
jgi:hypothetical protein